MKTKSSDINRFLCDRNKRKAAAKMISARIRSASSIAKVALNKKSRDTAYRLKTQLLELAFLKFADLFTICSFEIHPVLGIVLRIQMANGDFIHLPLRASSSFRLLVNLNSLQCVTTIGLQTPKRAGRRRFLGAAQLAYG